MNGCRGSPKRRTSRRPRRTDRGLRPLAAPPGRPASPRESRGAASPRSRSAALRSATGHFAHAPWKSRLTTPSASTPTSSTLPPSTSRPGRSRSITNSTWARRRCANSVLPSMGGASAVPPASLSAAGRRGRLAPMQVRVLLFGSLREAAGAKELSVALPERAVVRDLRDALAIAAGVPETCRPPACRGQSRICRRHRSARRRGRGGVPAAGLGRGELALHDLRTSARCRRGRGARHG